MKGCDFMKQKKDIGRVIGILSNQLKRQLDSTTNITFTGVQGRILHFILAQSEERDLFQKDIEEEFNFRCSTATGTLKLMEKHGFIQRTSVDYDARLKKIVVTEKGKLMREKVREDIDILEKKLRKNISDEDLEVFFSVAAQISKNLQ